MSVRTHPTLDYRYSKVKVVARFIFTRGYRDFLFLLILQHIANNSKFSTKGKFIYLPESAFINFTCSG
jgi:hypothetical protein